MKLKSREELVRLATDIRRLIHTYQGSKAVDLLQQLQEETVRCCAEKSLQHKLHGEDQTASGFYAAVLDLLPPQPKKKD